MKDWFNTRYSREDLRQFVSDHPSWQNKEVDLTWGRAALAAILENLDSEEVI